MYNDGNNCMRIGNFYYIAFYTSVALSRYLFVECAMAKAAFLQQVMGHESFFFKSEVHVIFCRRAVTVLVLIKLTKFAVALRLRCGSCKLIF